MKVSRAFVVIRFMVFSSSLSVAAGAEGELALQRLFAEMNDLRTTQNEALASNYPGTECVDFSFKKSKVGVGFVCASKNNLIRNQAQPGSPGEPVGDDDEGIARGGLYADELSSVPEWDVAARVPVALWH
jgi:hypothetical protein